MAATEHTNDPGLGRRFNDRTENKVINADGSFNVKRVGSNSFLNDTYHFLVHIPWARFTVLILLFYFCINTLFAFLYYAIGVEHLHGAEAATGTGRFLNSFFFSIQTFTTVGYGGIVPRGVLTSFVAASEALIGVISLAVITGLLYGRFSRPNAKIVYSQNTLVSPHKNHTGLMFRIANKRRSELIELQATVMMMTMDKSKEGYSRNYTNIDLDVSSIKFLPLNWTIVHTIDENSPLFEKDARFFEEHDVEFLVLIKAFDDTFSQTVYSRYSYKWNEVVWGAKFVQPFYLDDKGVVVLELDKLSQYVPAGLYS